MEEFQILELGIRGAEQLLDQLDERIHRAADVCRTSSRATRAALEHARTASADALAGHADIEPVQRVAIAILIERIAALGRAAIGAAAAIGRAACTPSPIALAHTRAALTDAITGIAEREGLVRGAIAVLVEAIAELCGNLALRAAGPCGAT